MTSERECYVYIVLPGETEFVTAGRFRVSETRRGSPLGEFVYGRRYLERPDAVEFDPVELRLADRLYETGRMKGSCLHGDPHNMARDDASFRCHRKGLRTDPWSVSVRWPFRGEKRGPMRI